MTESSIPHAGPGPISPNGTEWSLGTRVLFRFAFVYVILFYATYSGFFSPLSLPLAFVSQMVWGAVVSRVATGLLDVAPPPMVSDGDGLAQWIQMWGCVALAAVATVVWSWVDRGRVEYVKLHAWLMVIARYVLGIAMIVYGVVKIAHLQMLPPHLAKLVQPLGESSPTSLLWIFMGSSAAYSAFTGCVEFLGGLLLLNRRTALLGALVSLGAMIQVVVLNLAYDVSVKIWSMNLAALALLLVIPHMGRLVDVFFLNRPTRPQASTPLFRSPRRERTAFRIGMVCLAITLGFRVLGLLNMRGDQYNRVPTPIWGIHEIATFVSDGEMRPPLLTDAGRWHTMVIERSGLASVRYMDGSIEDYLTDVDTVASQVTFVLNPDTTVTTAGATRMAYDPGYIEGAFERAMEGGAEGVYSLGFTLGPDGDLTLSGDWDGGSIEVQTDRRDERDFLLLNRGFHWVQYYPYFR